MSMKSYPATVQQLRMLDFIQPRSDSYYLMIENLQYIGDVDTAALRSALVSVLDRHQVLRSAYVAESQEFRVIGSGYELIDDVFLHRGGFSDARAASAQAKIDIGGPMDVSMEAPLRLWIGELNEGGLLLSLAGHHLVFDAWTFMLFYEDLAAEYARQKDRRLPVRYPASQYADVQTPEAIVSPGEWDDLFSRDYTQVRRLSARASTPRGPAAESTRYWPGLSAGVRVAAKRHHVSPFVIASVAMLQSLASVLDDPEIILGSAHAGRTTVDAANTLGFFSTSMFMGVDLNEHREDPDLIRTVANILRRWQLSPRLQWEPLLDQHDAQDLYPFKFAFQPTELADRRMKLPGSDVSKFKEVNMVTTAKRPLDLISSYDADGIAASMIYRTDVLSLTQADSVIDQFAWNLERLSDSAA